MTKCITKYNIRNSNSKNVLAAEIYESVYGESFLYSSVSSITYLNT